MHLGRSRSETRGVKGRPALGAAIGLSVGLAMVGLLILLPMALQGSFYEVSDPLVIMGVPLVVISAAVGSIVAGPGRRGMADVQGGSTARPRTRAVVVGRMVALVACLLALWLFLWGVGALDTPPLGII